MKVRWKLVAILIVPLCALVTLAWVGISQRRQVASEAGRVRSIVDLAQATTDTKQHLESELIASAVMVGSDGVQGTADLATDRTQTDASVANLLGRLRSFNSAPYGSAMKKAVTDLETSLGAVATARGDVDTRGTSGRAGIATLQTPLTAMDTVVEQVASKETEPSVAISLAAYATFAQAKLYEAQRLVSLGLMSGAGQASAAEVGDLRNIIAQQSYQANAFLALAPDSFKQTYKSAVTGAPFDTLRAFETVVLAAQGSNTRLDPHSLVTYADLQSVLNGNRVVEQKMEADIGGQARKRADDADRAVRAYMIVALATLGFSIVSASLVGRSITRPLRRLSVAARSVATVQLPKLVEAIQNPGKGELPELPPLATGSRDEIGELALAFDAIQSTAVGVAREQTELVRKGIGDLFVNLARRNQSLIDRQIAFLDELEAHEADPDTLDDLFKLDHLATRMRRNAESLLVLAGVESQRRWGKPVPISDVVRASVAEVEDYSRLHISTLDDRLVQGNAAADIAHLMAELFDNATQFSPPATHVEVRGVLAHDGYLVTITDLGIGMSSEHLADANETVQHPPVTGLGLSRSLGFTVVGRLAARYGIHVEMAANPVGGITATVFLPPNVLTGLGDLSTNGNFAAPTPGTVTSFAPPSRVERVERARGSAGADTKRQQAVEAAAASAEVEGDAAPERRAPLPNAEPTPAWGRPVDVPPAVWERLVSSSNPHWDKAPRAAASPPASLAEALPSAPDGLAIAPPVVEPRRADPLIRRREGTGSPLALEPVAPRSSGDIVDRPAAATPLPRRVRGGNGIDTTAQTFEAPRASARTPEQIRDLLSSYRGGLNKGREQPAEEDQT